MTISEIAKRLVTLNQAHEYETIYQELYAPDAESIETWDGTSTSYKGMDEIKRKAAEWFESVDEIHEIKCSEPLLADKSFAVSFYMDISYKGQARQPMTELAIYTVADGKIVREEFRA